MSIGLKAKTTFGHRQAHQIHGSSSYYNTLMLFTRFYRGRCSRENRAMISTLIYINMRMGQNYSYSKYMTVSINEFVSPESIPPGRTGRRTVRFYLLCVILWIHSIISYRFLCLSESEMGIINQWELTGYDK